MKHRVIGLLLLLPCSAALAAAPEPEELKAHDDQVYSVAFSPDGKYLATGGFDNVAKIWDFAQRKELYKLTGHTQPVYCVAFNKDGSMLATSSADMTIRLWNVADGKFIREIKGHTGIVDSIAFSPDGKSLASASSMPDKSVRLWNVDDAKEIKNLGMHGGSAYVVAFSSDGKYLASAGGDNLVKVWDVMGQKELKQLRGHTLGATGVAFAPDDKSLFSVSQDKTLRQWDFLSGNDPNQLPLLGATAVGLMGSSWGHGPLLTASLPNPDKSEMKNMGPTPDDLYGLAFSKDGKALATCGYAGNVTLWNLADGKPATRRKLPKPLAMCIAFTPDGKALVTGHKNVIYITPLEGK
jgi:WD40 repeat protein